MNQTVSNIASSIRRQDDRFKCMDDVQVILEFHADMWAKMLLEPKSEEEMRFCRQAVRAQIIRGLKECRVEYDDAVLKASSVFMQKPGDRKVEPARAPLPPAQDSLFGNVEDGHD